MDALQTYGFGAVSFAKASTTRAFSTPATSNVASQNPNGQSDKVGTNNTGGRIPGVFTTSHHQNPLFWFLVLALLFTGYVGFLFDFNVKRIGEVRLKGGR